MWKCCPVFIKAATPAASMLTFQQLFKNPKKKKKEEDSSPLSSSFCLLFFSGSTYAHCSTSQLRRKLTSSEILAKLSRHEYFTLEYLSEKRPRAESIIQAAQEWGSTKSASSAGPGKICFPDHTLTVHYKKNAATGLGIKVLSRRRAPQNVPRRQRSDDQSLFRSVFCEMETSRYLQKKKITSLSCPSVG